MAWTHLQWQLTPKSPAPRSLTFLVFFLNATGHVHKAGVGVATPQTNGREIITCTHDFAGMICPARRRNLDLEKLRASLDVTVTTDNRP